MKGHGKSYTTLFFCMMPTMSQWHHNRLICCNKHIIRHQSFSLTLPPPGEVVLRAIQTHIYFCVPLSDTSIILFAPSGISQRSPWSSDATSWIVSLHLGPFCSIPYLLLGISLWSSRYQAAGSDSSGTSHSSTATSRSFTSTSFNGRLNRTAGPEE